MKAGHIPRRRASILTRKEFADKSTVHTKDNIRSEVLRIVSENLTDERLVTVRDNDEVNMRRTVRMAVLFFEQLSDGPMCWDRIACRSHRTKTEEPVGIGTKTTTQVHVGLFRVLVFV